MYRGHHTRDVVATVRQEGGAGRMSNVDMSRAILAHLGNPEERRRRASIGLVEKLKMRRDMNKEETAARSRSSKATKDVSRGGGWGASFGAKFGGNGNGLSEESMERRRPMGSKPKHDSRGESGYGQGASLADAKAMAELEKQVARPAGSSRKLLGGSFRGRSGRRGSTSEEEEEAEEEELEANAELLHFANRFLWLSSMIDDVSTVLFPLAFGIFTAVIFGPVPVNLVWSLSPTVVELNATARDWTLGSDEVCQGTDYDGASGYNG